MFIWIWFLGVAWGVTAEELLLAMEVPEDDVISVVLSGQAVASDIVTNFGILQSTAPPTMGVLSSGHVGSTNPDPGTDMGNYGVNGDTTMLGVNLLVPDWANSFSLDFYFLSAEYPVYVGTSYNDTFLINVAGLEWTGNAALDNDGNEVSVNSALFAVTDQQSLQGTGFVGHGATGWLTVLVPVAPLDEVGIGFSIGDLGDGILDSTVLMDGFEWSEDDIDEPIIVRPLRVDYCSPKRSDVVGGLTTTITGDAFGEDCVAYFDGIEAATQYLDEQHMKAVVPPHLPGLIDMKVKCYLDYAEQTLVGGFTYYEADSGLLSPEIQGIEPYWVMDSGEEIVSVYGTEFDHNAQIKVDDELVETVWEGTTVLTFVAPEHEAGLADVTVVNPSGLSDTRSGGLLYVFIPEEREEEMVGSTDFNQGQKQCACAWGVLSPFGLWWCALWVVARRRAIQ